MMLTQIQVDVEKFRSVMLVLSNAITLHASIFRFIIKQYNHILCKKRNKKYLVSFFDQLMLQT